MADKTSKTEDSSAESKSTESKSTAPEAPLSDAKAKMREALDRKKANEDHLTAEGRRNTGQVHGSEVTGGRRMFRRKSGG